MLWWILCLQKIITFGKINYQTIEGENMEIKDDYVKSYQDKTWLEDQLQTKSSRQIAKEMHVSYKLINKWALTHGLIKSTPDLKLP